MNGRGRALMGFVVLALIAIGALAGGGLWLWASRPNARSIAQLSGAGPATSPSGGVLGQFSPVDPPRPAPPLSFEARDGSPRSLADFRGRWVLVNLWATWCEPCVREMPSLDRLQEKMGRQLAVLAISEDRGATHVVDPFLEKLALKNLAIYLDPKGAVGQALGVRGLPTTVLIDGEGRILAQLEGEAKWDTEALQTKLEHLMRRGTSAAEANTTPSH